MHWYNWQPEDLSIRLIKRKGLFVLFVLLPEGACMSRRLAHRPRYQQARVNSQSSLHCHQEYLRHRWFYRQQRDFLPKNPLGYGLMNLPWGWRSVRNASQRRA